MLGLTISGTVESLLELTVGIMIAGLGLRVLWKLRRERIHIHAHAHDGKRHVHAHSHAGDPDSHNAALHRHDHTARAMPANAGCWVDPRRCWFCRIACACRRNGPIYGAGDVCICGVWRRFHGLG